MAQNGLNSMHQLLTRSLITFLAGLMSVSVLTINCYSQEEQKFTVLLPVPVNGRWGYINVEGNFVINPRFAIAGNFSEGLAPVRDDEGGFYYIDTTGNVITNGNRYRLAEDFSEGLAAIQGERFDDKRGFIDRSGNMAIAPQFDSYTGKMPGRFQDGLAFVQINGKIGFIDYKGNFVIEPRFDSDRTLSATPFSEGLAVIRTKGNYGYISKSGNILIAPHFDDAEPFSEGLAAVSFDRLKFGFINMFGIMAIEPRFDWASSFSEGLAAVNIGMAWHGHQKSGGKWGFIDKSGKVVIDVKYEVANPFSEGLARLSKLKGNGALLTKRVKCESSRSLVGLKALIMAFRESL